MSTNVTINNAKELVNIIKDAYNNDVDIIVESNGQYESVAFERYVNREAVNVSLRGFIDNKYISDSYKLGVMHNMRIFIRGKLVLIDQESISAIIEFPIRIKSYTSRILNARFIDIYGF